MNQDTSKRPTPTTPTSIEQWQICIVLYEGVTQLDFTGPYEVLRHLPGAHIVLATLSGGALDLGGRTSPGGGFSLLAAKRLAEVESCDLLLVPGGPGTARALRQPQLIDEIGRLASGARWVASVCTGSLLLGAAGLLQGKRAASHWAWRHWLARFGAIVDRRRVVRDGKVLSGGGVTAGVDMALALVAEAEGEELARKIQLLIEYAPAPPFDAGTPELAGASPLQGVQEWIAPMIPEREAAVEWAAGRLRLDACVYK